MPCAPLQSGNLALGCLYFSDGSQKSLAGFITWVSMCLASQLEKHQGTLADNVHLQTSAASLLRIQTTVKGSTGSSDELDNTIARIVKQNVDAKVMPVSSLTWVTVLRSLTSEPTGFDAAMAKYNSHPEVVSFDSGSSGAISLDNRKKQAKGRGEVPGAKTLDGVFHVALVHTHTHYAHTFVGEIDHNYYLCGQCLYPVPQTTFVSDSAQLHQETQGVQFFFKLF